MLLEWKCKFHGQKQWPPKFHIKFRNTENLHPYLENIPKKQFFSASLKKQLQLKNVILTLNRGSSSCSTCLKKQEQIPLKKISNAEMINLIGNDITYYRENHILKNNQFLFDYEKKEIKEKRKMGHLTTLK